MKTYLQRRGTSMRLLLLIVFLFTLILNDRSPLTANENGDNDIGTLPEGVLTETMQALLRDREPAHNNVTVLNNVPCIDGMAGIYPCENVNLLSHIPLSTFEAAGGNDSWGWTDPLDNKEYAIMGLNNGTVFVDISDPVNPIYLGKLPTETVNSSWRDIKVYNNYAFVVSEASNHGMQVFDLTELRTVVSPPVTFSNTAHYDDFGRAHNLVINEDSGFAYAVGSNSCSGGLHMIDIQDPTAPAFAGCFSSDGYTHDAQCVIYNGPDPNYQGQEICFNSNENTLTIVDVTIKNAPVQISRTGYPNHGYTHQGWLTEDQAYFLLGDELDESNFGHNTRTRIWDVSNLEAPVLTGFHDATTAAIDHNLYTRGNYVYQANYRAGLRILDMSDIANANLTEVAYFDIYPANDNPNFNGAWNSFPYYESGVVIISGMEQGLFIVQPLLAADFSMSVSESTLAFCGDDSDSVTVDITPQNEYTGTVTLDTLGLPAGATSTFTLNPVSVPGSSDLTITTSGVTAGNYPFTLNGDDGTLTHDIEMALSVAHTIPTTPSLSLPPNGSGNQPLLVTLTWNAVADALTYELEIAADSEFNDIIVSENGLTAVTHTINEPLDPDLTYYWRVRSVNDCGAGDYSSPFSFSTGSIPPILLVDDDDNSPDVRSYYTTALDALGVDYDIWDTNNSDDEPSAVELAPYSVVIWFTGDEFGGAAGPGSSGETALSSWLDDGNCLFISSQDYYYDRGLTPFMSSYLGVDSASSDNGNYSAVSGEGSLFGGLGPYDLVYPFSDYSDIITPDATAELAFIGNNSNNAAVNKDNGVYKTSFWGFPFEAIGTAGQRQEAMAVVLNWCTPTPYGVELSPDMAEVGAAGTTVTYTLTVTNMGLVSDTFALSLSGNMWTTHLSATEVTLDVSENTTVTVGVNVPEDALASDSDAVVVTAASAGGPIDTAVLTTTVAPFYGVSIGPNAEGSGYAGTTVTYTLYITNTGNDSDTFTLTAAGNWDATFSVDSVPLNAGESITVTVGIEIPAAALHHTSEIVTVTATSTEDVTESDSAALTTAVLFDSYYLYLPLLISEN
jgi:choice-of-anchor B domain-containing protein